MRLNRSAYKATVTLQCGSGGALTKLRGRKDRHLIICVVYSRNFTVRLNGSAFKVTVTLQCGSIGALTKLRGREDRPWLFTQSDQYCVVSCRLRQISIVSWAVSSVRSILCRERFSLVISVLWCELLCSVIFIVCYGLFSPVISVLCCALFCSSYQYSEVSCSDQSY